MHVKSASFSFMIIFGLIFRRHIHHAKLCPSREIFLSRSPATGIFYRLQNAYNKFSRNCESVYARARARGVVFATLRFREDGELAAWITIISEKNERRIPRPYIIRALRGKTSAWRTGARGDRGRGYKFAHEEIVQESLTFRNCSL